jgi:phenylacetate-CoA ligase
MKFSTILFALRVLKRYLFYLRSEHWDRERIEKYQDLQLKKLIKHAGRHVPYYRELFQKINLDPEQFRGREDMHKIPLLAKDVLRTRQKDFIADNAARFGINWDSTSGSTGTPLHLIIDNSTKAHKLAAVLRAYQWAGYSPGKRTFSIQSYTFADKQAIAKRYPLANLWRFNSKLLNRDTALEILRMVNDLQPDIFIGYPFSILMLSQFAAKEGVAIKPVGTIITAGETLSKQRRTLLEEAYNCDVHDFFSHHEDVAVISECRHKTKHIYENFAYNEVIDEDSQNLSGSDTGRLVGTGFYNYAMPLIRYDISDRVIIDTDNRICPCGCSFRIVEEIVGRQNDFLETPDGRFLGNVLEHAVDNAVGVKLSQCVQDAVDHIYVNMIVDDAFSEESVGNLEQGLRQRLGDEIRIDFKVVDHLEQTKSGKTPFIMSKIGHTYI